MSTEYRIASPHLAQFVQAIWRQAGSTAREAELGPIIWCRLIWPGTTRTASA